MLRIDRRPASAISALCLALFLGAARGRAADDFVELMHAAAAESTQGKYGAAIDKYRAALALHPGSANALNNLAVMYYESKLYRQAFDTAMEVWPRHKELPSAALIAGMAAVQCDRPRDALAPLEDLLTSQPHNRDALLALASAHFALHDMPSAVAVYEREIASAPADSTAWYGLAICYETLAESASAKLARMPGGFALSKKLLGEYLQSAGDTRLAAEAFGAAAPGEAASSAAAQQQYAEARTLAEKSRNAFERFVAQAPDSWQAAIFLGDVERQHGNLAAALAHYQKAAQEQPESAGALLGLGTTYWEMGDFDRSAAALHQALAINPQALQATFELANIAVRKHDDEAAIRLLTEYLRKQPDAAAARADLGRAYLHREQYANAANELAKAAEADERGDIHYQLSVALKRLGRNDEAQAALAESTRLREAQLKREQELRTTH